MFTDREIKHAYGFHSKLSKRGKIRFFTCAQVKNVWNIHWMRVIEIKAAKQKRKRQLQCRSSTQLCYEWSIIIIIECIWVCMLCQFENKPNRNEKASISHSVQHSTMCINLLIATRRLCCLLAVNSIVPIVFRSQHSETTATNVFPCVWYESERWELKAYNIRLVFGVGVRFWLRECEWKEKKKNISKSNLAEWIHL